MQTRLHFAALLFTSIAFTQVAQADQLAAIKAKGELVCGTLGTDEPNSFIDAKSRQLVGYEVDLCRAIAQGIGVKPVIKQLAVAARIPELQQGRVDILTASLTHNKEREALVDFSLSTFYTGQRVLVKKSSNITTVAGLAGKKVLTVKGGTQEPNIRKAVPGVDVVTFETAGQAYLGL
ncbi:MAG: transporter substrate-binding domain-containing protein, partial [Janthinobacterium sp.]